MNRLILPITIFCTLVLIQAQANEPPDARKQVISAGEASRDAKLATSRIQLPSGMKAELFAAEPLLANPVAFCFDPKGNIYVAETFRIHDGVTDNRSHMYWLNDELACTTVADRDTKYKKYLKDRYQSYEKERDQVRKLIDSTGSGKPDKSFVFSDNYRRAVDGLGSGVLAHQGNIYFTCIPDLWLLKDTRNTHRADLQKSLSTGYGVHTSFIGHDLHGLAVSPVDGKIYFSIGDRGANLTTREGRQIEVPHTGAVFRCQPDGSELELFAKGLRNPQELAFDDDGNLFTGDNNSDSGDKARFVYLPYGADCGWHIGWQYLEQPYSRGCWNSEFLWHPARPDQPAYIVPPLINLGDGPSGLVYYPGTGLSDRYQGHFFLADFRGTPNNSGIRSFAVKPKGAGFEVVDSHKFAWGVLATDVDFGPDGAMYILDWVEGWGKTGKGRIHRVYDPNQVNTAQAKALKALLASDWSRKTIDELVLLLGHVDRRVRMEAQATLIQRTEKKQAIEACLAALKQASDDNTRVFLIWTLGQLLRVESHLASSVYLKELLHGKNPRCTLAVLRTLCDTRPPFELESEDFLQCFIHPSDQVKAEAAICLGQHPTQGAISALIRLVNQGSVDPWLRHAAVMGLSGMLKKYPVYWKTIQGVDADKSTRVVGVLAARKLQLEEKLQDFLSDSDLTVCQEAIRALHDEPGMPAGKAKLAEIAIRTEYTIPVQLRLLHSQYMRGDDKAASKLADFVMENERNATLRSEAVRMLGTWANPSGRDWVLGLWRPIPARSDEPAKTAVLSSFTRWKTAKYALLTEMVRTAEKLKLKQLQQEIIAIARSEATALETKLAALQCATTLQSPDLEKLAAEWLTSKEPALRQAARSAMVKLHPEKAVNILDKMYAEGSIREKQSAIGQLAQLRNKEADQKLEALLKDFAAGKSIPEVQLELQEAVTSRDKAEWKALWQSGLQQLSKQGPYAEHRATLLGGDGAEGRKIFFEKIAAACLRCHKVGKEGGEVGPEMTLIGKEKNREYLLEAIVDPNKTIAKGFELSIILTADGVVHQGVVRKEDASTVTIITPEAKTETLKKADIEERKTGKSAMPEDTIKHLTPRELRDLLEYLANLK